MTREDAQLRLDGGETPLDDLDLSPNLLLLAPFRPAESVTP